MMQDTFVTLREEADPEIQGELNQEAFKIYHD